MGKVYEQLDDELAQWLLAQPMYLVATAPLAADGLVNCSPKGGSGTFAVLSPTQVAYLDLTGSGIETVAHVRENGRIVLVFCSFERRPTIVRLHGSARVLVPGDAGFEELLARFSPHVGSRSVVVVDLLRISDSCGYAVPLMELVGERDLLDRSHEKRGPDGLQTYRRERNAVSLDGLPGLPAR
jgi:hypothetical protein